MNSEDNINSPSLPQLEDLDPTLAPWMVDMALSKHRCNLLSHHLIQRAHLTGLGIHEGLIRSKVQPYRRLDCAGRALAYLRPRPRSRGLRVDIPGTWRPPGECELSVNGANAAASLLIREFSELDRAVEFLRETVKRTRERWGSLEARARLRPDLSDHTGLSAPDVGLQGSPALTAAAWPDSA